MKNIKTSFSLTLLFVLVVLKAQAATHLTKGISISYHENPLAIGEAKIDEKGLITWKTNKETEKVLFTIEQYRWDKWIPVGEVKATGKVEGSNYEYQVTDFHSGENKFRIKQVNSAGKETTSRSLTINPNIAAVSYSINNEKGVIEFSDVTMYEVNDTYGNSMAKGKGKVVSFTKFEKKSVYYLNYDNKTTPVILK